MLWHKAWLDVRWRILIGLAVLLVMACGVVIEYPTVVRLRPLAMTIDPGDGVVGTRTWNRLMRIRPVRVRWSAAHRRNKAAGASASSAPLSAPLSADLPPVRNEIAGAKHP